MATTFNLLDCDQACLGCIKKYKKKHDLKAGDSFEIKCNGIPKEYISLPMMANIPEETVTSMISMLDPVTWAKEVLDWHCFDSDGSIWKRKTTEGSLDEVTPYIEERYSELVGQGKSAYNRPYQAEMLRCTAKRKLFRCGRQIGKSETICVAILHSVFTHKDFKVIIITPYQTQIEVIFGRLEKLIKGSQNLKNSIRRNVKAPNYTIELYNGSMIKGFSCVAGTLIVTNRGLIPIEEIKLNDQALSLNTDGSQLGFLPVTEVFQPNYKKVYRVLLNDGHEVIVSDDHPFWTKEGWKPLKELKLGDKVAVANNYKFTYKALAEPDTLSYLLGLLLGDGNFTEKTLAKGGPRFTSSNPIIQRNFEDALTKLDIGWRSQIHRRTGSMEYTIKKCIEQVHCRPQDKPFTELTKVIYKFGLNGKRSLSKFIPRQLINSSLEVRLGLLKGLMETDGYLQVDGTAGFCSISRELAYGMRDLLNTFGIRATIRVKKQAGKTIKINTEQRYIYPKYDMYEVNIRSKDSVQQLLKVVDLSAKGSAYIACKKNSAIGNRKEVTDISFSKIRSIEYMKEDTTYDIAVGDGTNNFIANGIILHNTAGTKSGGNADAVRGQKANMLVFDEADYLNAADMASALAVITNYPDATVWMSSTPTGKRERFYESAHNPLYREFHYPSNINPLWNKDLEDFYHGEFTDIEYAHEILAEFGEQAQGVYQASYIDAALEDYRYNESRRIDGWFYCMGVDWNDTRIGTTIAIVGFNPTTNTFKLVYRTVVSREGWTQLAACERIAELNREWRPEYIYIDKGFGSTQAEVLNKFGYDALLDKERGRGHPDSRLMRIVKTYDFGSKVTIKDLFTRQDREKPSKPFLVENSVRRFEQQTIKISKYDNQLQEELRGYIIDHVTSTGLPVYKQGNEKAGDHNLDALNLALVAFTLEMSQFGKVNYQTGIAFTGNIGQPKSEELDKAANTKLKSATTAREENKPELNRTTVIEFQKDTKPAANLNQNTGRRLWSWPGFESDAPKPRPIIGMTGTFRPKPPARKKF